MDFLSLNAAYFAFIVFEYQKTESSWHYRQLFFIINAAWLIEYIVVNKYSRIDTPCLIDRFFFLFKSSVYTLTLTTLLIVSFHLQDYSRTFVLQLFFVHFLFLLAIHARYYRPVDVRHILPPIESRILHNFTWKQFFLDLVIVPGAFILVRWFKSGSLQLGPSIQQQLVLFTGLWMAFSFWTAKFSKKNAKNIYFKLGPELRVLAYMTVSIAFLIFILGVKEFSRFEMFGPVVLIFVLKCGYIVVKYQYYGLFSCSGDVEEIFDVQSRLSQEELLIPEPKSLRVSRSIDVQLRDKYLSNMPELYHFLHSSITLQNIETEASVVLNTKTLYNIEILKDLNIQLLINLHKVNDIGPINKYFLISHLKLAAGGYLVGCKTTMESYRSRFYQKYPRNLARPLYVLDFIVHRVWPKLRGLNVLHHFIFKKRSKIISRAELFGRLSFCGFYVKQSVYIEDVLYFIAQKTKHPSFDTNPSYGPVIKLKRIGLDGKFFDLYKFRTMHPYSEYIQDFVYEQNKLDKSGKIKDDFRLTEWGKIMRKYWLDEIPQIYNFLRGDIGLVGVRALSMHFFKLYPSDVQKLRTRLKPGILPPYYADMPESFEEIVESERRYLQEKLKRPISTDIKYFIKIMKNILIKRVRSG